MSPWAYSSLSDCQPPLVVLLPIVGIAVTTLETPTVIVCVLCWDWLVPGPLVPSLARGPWPGAQAPMSNTATSVSDSPAPR
jgi:hypothetical protein